MRQITSKSAILLYKTRTKIIHESTIDLITSWRWCAFAQARQWKINKNEFTFEIANMARIRELLMSC